jgi:hypothetical protein
MFALSLLVAGANAITAGARLADCQRGRVFGQIFQLVRETGRTFDQRCGRFGL